MSTGQNRFEASKSVADERRLWLALVEQSAKADLLQAQLAQLRGSLSWRVTAPLRALRSLVGKERGRPSLDAQDNELALPRADVDHSTWVSSLRAGDDDNGQRWLVDVTELSHEDLGAGVERVTRRLLTELLLSPPPGARIQPVRLVEQGSYVCANRFLASFLGMPSSTFGADVDAAPRAGDCFVGLDFCRGHAVPLEQALKRLRDVKVPVHLLVHDVLPMTHPQWFPAKVPREFAAWLRVLARYADGAVCNSHHTARELRAAMEESGLRDSSLEMFVIPLGADFPPASFANPLPAAEASSFRVLTVGTIEPRKGHAQALAAFEALWRGGLDVQWVIAGKAGWSVQELVASIRRHPEFGRRLLWLDGPDDRVLEALYGECDLLLAPSQGEGYGLPVAEAGRAGMPLLLRDIPVFREIAGEGARYFCGDDPLVLAESLSPRFWGAGRRIATAPRWKTWAQSADELKRICVTRKSTNTLE